MNLFVRSAEFTSDTFDHHLICRGNTGTVCIVLCIIYIID